MGRKLLDDGLLRKYRRAVRQPGNAYQLRTEAGTQRLHPAAYRSTNPVRLAQTLT